MPAPKQRKRSPWVILAWTLNIIGLGALALVLIAYLAMKPARAAQQDINANTFGQLPPTYTPVASVYYLSTITPNPRTTKIVAIPPTPFVLPQGDSRSTVIGYSVSGRPIEIYTFGDGPSERMIVAGIHGGYEWNTIALADQLITYIYENPEVIPDNVTLYILRNMNPDGDAREHGIDGRINDHGVDLNRNFPANWAEEWNRDGCWIYAPTTGGTGPGSEPETRAVMYFLQTHKIEVLISYHSAALGVFPGGEPWEKHSTDFAKALAKATKYPFPPIDTGCVYTGTLADYAVEQGAVSVDMELSTHSKTDYSQNLKALDVLLHWKY